MRTFVTARVSDCHARDAWKPLLHARAGVPTPSARPCRRSRGLLHARDTFPGVTAVQKVIYNDRCSTVLIRIVECISKLLSSVRMLRVQHV